MKRRTGFPVGRRALAAAGLLLVMAVAPAMGQNEPLIAVLPFQSIEVAASVAQIITTLFETSLVNTKAYVVLSQTERRQILEAQEVALADCTDESCAVEIGRLLSAEQIIIGTVAALGKKYIINAKIIDVSSSRTLGADSVSAENVEELDVACRKLTYALVEKAIPGFTVAEAPAPAQDQEAAPQPEPQPSPPAGPAETEPQEVRPQPQEVRPQPQEPPQEARSTGAPARPSPAAYVLLAGGVAALEAGNVAGAAAFETSFRVRASQEAYATATSGFTDLYNAYQGDYTLYAALGISSYSLWGLGGAGISASSLLFSRDLAVTRLGRVAFLGGSVLNLLGNVLGAFADNQRYTLYGANSADLLYSLFRIGSYVLWGVGGTGMVGALLLPGEKEVLAPSGLQRALLAAGSVMVALGSAAHSVSMNLRPGVEASLAAYLEAGAGQDFAGLYGDYQSSYASYAFWSILSYGLWGVGAAATVTSLLVRGGAAQPQEAPGQVRPAQLAVAPAPSGIQLTLTINPGKERK